MPEGPIIAQEVDFMTKLLRVNGVWENFVGASKFSKKFEHVDLNLLIPALGQPIVDIRFKGKEFFILLPHDLTLHVHHRMSGSWSTEPDGKNTHFQLRFSNDKVLYYNNQRFGDFEIFTTKQQFEDRWNKLAPGFLGIDLISLEEWRRRFATVGPRKVLYTLLMDQNILCSGIGNFLAAEILWCCGIKPDKKVGELTEKQIDLLYEASKLNVIGHYENRMMKVIYKKDFTPSGNPIEAMKIGGRSVWWCPKEQF